MKKVKIIALSGFIGSGKDYIAKLAEKQFGYKHLKLAWLVKYVVCQVEGISLEELEDRKNKEKYRPLIIEYANKIKEVDSLSFCKEVYHQILLSLPEKTNFVISDLRYPYEALYFRKLARCAKTECEVEHKGIPDYQVEFKSLYIESNLTANTSTDGSEANYDYFKKTNDGIIFNWTEQRYSRDNADLINQLIKFV